MTGDKSRKTRPDFLPPNPVVTLGPATVPISHRTWQWDDQARKLAEGTARGWWRVEGPAGSGVTSLLAAVAAARRGLTRTPDSVQVITASKESAVRLRRLIDSIPLTVTDSHNKAGIADTLPVARSIHAVAFSLVRAAAIEDHAPIPRLLTGAEHDAMIRELLQGQAADQTATMWPEDLRPAVTFDGFALELKDLFLRAAERGITPDQLVVLGQKYNRPAWASAGEFFRLYTRVTRLMDVHDFTAGELIAEAHRVLDEHPLLEERELSRISTLIVDDAQDFDPLSAKLVERLAVGAKVVAIGGDQSQHIFRFRGADTGLMTRPHFDGHVTLEEDQRRKKGFSRSAVICPSAAIQADLVADTVRRRHLIDGVDYRDMAVIVRSPQAAAPLKRRLAEAGVPVKGESTDIVLAQQPLVRSLLLAVEAVNRPLSRTETEELVTGPIGGADPVTLRRLYRGLRHAELKNKGTRRAVDVLADLVLPAQHPGHRPLWDDESTAIAELVFLTDREIEILQRIAVVTQAAAQATAEGASAEELLWAVWNATGLAQRLSAASLRGGSLGARADEDLDAVMALFDLAGDYTERTGGSAQSFIAKISSQKIPTGTRARAGAVTDAITLLSAHGARGLEWDTVIVAGVQEGTWPTFGETGTLFGQEELVDLLDQGIEPDVFISRSGERLTDEKNLFHVATTRATDFLLVTAVDDPDSDQALEPSRFMTDDILGFPVTPLHSGRKKTEPEPRRTKQEAVLYARAEWEDSTAAGSRIHWPIRLLSVPAIVGELRRAVCDNSPASRQAARQLARLSEAGIAGADPSTWWGLQDPSTTDPIVDRHSPRKLSPSRVEALLTCPVMALFDGISLDTTGAVHMAKGTLIHAFAEAYASGVDPGTAKKAVAAAWEEVNALPPWKRKKEQEDFDAILDRTKAWVDETLPGMERLGVEVPVTVTVGSTNEGTPLIVTGRVDQVLKTTRGEIIVVDLKTGNRVWTKAEAENNPQMFTYQLALSRAGITDAADDASDIRFVDGEGLVPGGAFLVFPGKASADGRATLREQSPKTALELEAFTTILSRAAAAVTGYSFEAFDTKTCRGRDLGPVCAYVAEGKTVTNAG